MPESFAIVCPRCSRHLKSRNAISQSRRVRCPHCGAIIALQAANPVAVPALPPGKRRGAGLVLAGMGVALLSAIGFVCYLAFHNDQPPGDSDTSTEPTTLTPKQPGKDMPLPESLTVTDRPPTHKPIAPREDAEPNLPWLTADRQAQVDAAIQRGVAFLKASQAASGTWSDDYHPAGLAALPALTLLECGITPTNPCLNKAIQYVRDNASRLESTYELALVLLMLERRGDEADRPLIRSLALRLLAGQSPAGGWSYPCPLLRAEQERDLQIVLDALRPTSSQDLFATNSDEAASADKPSAPDKRPEDLQGEARTAYAALPAELRALAALQPPTQAHQLPLADHSDNSNTQFAVLALWAAGRQGLPVERALALTATRFRFSQSLNGGWNYHYAVPNHASTPAMTCAGLLGLAVGHGLIVQHKSHPTHAAQVDDVNVLRGMRALADYVSNTGEAGDNKSRSAINLYFLWSLARVGLVYRTRTIDGKDWYAGSVAQVLSWQETNGSWKANVYAEATPILNTCFALLILRRSHLTQELSRTLRFELFTKELPEAPK
jgi:DNA-directed RNA polymerase subunit RPC12/RpoP